MGDGVGQVVQAAVAAGDDGEAAAAPLAGLRQRGGRGGQGLEDHQERLGFRPPEGLGGLDHRGDPRIGRLGGEVEGPHHGDAQPILGPAMGEDAQVPPAGRGAGQHVIDLRARSQVLQGGDEGDLPPTRPGEPRRGAVPPLRLGEQRLAVGPEPARPDRGLLLVLVLGAGILIEGRDHPVAHHQRCAGRGGDDPRLRLVRRHRGRPVDGQVADILPEARIVLAALGQDQLGAAAGVAVEADRHRQRGQPLGVAHRRQLVGHRVGRRRPAHRRGHKDDQGQQGPCAKPDHVPTPAAAETIATIMRPISALRFYARNAT